MGQTWVISYEQNDGNLTQDSFRRILVMEMPACHACLLAHTHAHTCIAPHHSHHRMCSGNDDEHRDHKHIRSSFIYILSRFRVRSHIAVSDLGVRDLLQ